MLHSVPSGRLGTAQRRVPARTQAFTGRVSKLASCGSSVRWSRVRLAPSPRAHGSLGPQFRCPGPHRRERRVSCLGTLWRALGPPRIAVWMRVGSCVERPRLNVLHFRAGRKMTLDVGAPLSPNKQTNTFGPWWYFVRVWNSQHIFHICVMCYFTPHSCIAYARMINFQSNSELRYLLPSNIP